MTNRGRGNRNGRGGGRNNNQPPPAFDQQAFMEAIGTMATTLAQISTNVGQRGSSNLQNFKARKPPTFMGRGRFDGGRPLILTS